MAHQEKNNEQPQGLTPSEKLEKIVEAINEYISTHAEELKKDPAKEASLRGMLNRAGTL